MPAGEADLAGQDGGSFERTNAWLLENRRLALRYDRSAFVIRPLLQTTCIFLVAGRLAWEF
jgi:hypothetical protein